MEHKWIRDIEAGIALRSKSKRRGLSSPHNSTRSPGFPLDKGAVDVVAHPNHCPTPTGDRRPLEWGMYFSRPQPAYDTSLGSLAGHRPRCRRRTQAAATFRDRTRPLANNLGMFETDAFNKDADGNPGMAVTQRPQTMPAEDFRQLAEADAFPTKSEFEAYVTTRRNSDLAGSASPQKSPSGTTLRTGEFGEAPPLPAHVLQRRKSGVPPPDTISARKFVYATGILGRSRYGSLDYASLDDRPGSVSSALPALEQWLEDQSTAQTMRGRHASLPSPSMATTENFASASGAAPTDASSETTTESPLEAALAADAIDTASREAEQATAGQTPADTSSAAAATAAPSNGNRPVPQRELSMLRSDSQRLLTLEPREFLHPSMPTSPMQVQIDTQAAVTLGGEAGADSAESFSSSSLPHEPHLSGLQHLKAAAQGTLAVVHLEHLRKQREADLQRCVPRVVQPKVLTDGIAKSTMTATEFDARSKPGVGQYDAAAAHRAQVNRRQQGKFNEAIVPSALELAMARSAKLPGPGAYDAPPRPMRGGKISASSALSDVEIKMAVAAKSPGPGEYDTSRATSPMPSGGRFNSAIVPSDLEKQIATAAKSPGPGAYPGVQENSSSRMSGGKFNAAVVPSDLESRMRQAALTPGPCAYDTTTQAGATKGGRMSATSPPTELEWIERRGSLSPGPGAYDVRSAAKHTMVSEHSGKFPFVWRPLDPKLAKLAKGVTVARAAKALQG